MSSQKMTGTKPTNPDTQNVWCVCGRTNSDEPWELVEGNFASFEAAQEFLASYVFHGTFKRDFADECEIYIDRESNDGYDHSYYDVRGGELIYRN